MNFENEIKEIKQGRRESFANGCSRVAYLSDCGKFVIKATPVHFRCHNKSEVKLWNKTQSFLLNPIIWHSRNFDFVVQRKLRVAPYSGWVESKDSRIAKKAISKMFEVKHFYDVEEIGYNFEIKDFQSNNRFVKELRKLYELGLPCDDLHLGNWGEDILGRFVLIDYSTIL